MTRPSSPGSCSGSSWRPGQSTRSSSVPARRLPRRTLGWSRRSSAHELSTSTRRAGRPAGSAGCSGAPSPDKQRSSGSRPAATPQRPRPCSASATTGSSAPTVTAATTTSTRPAARSAGRTCSATSRRTARECANNKTSETPALWSHTTCSRPGSASSRTVTAPRFRPRSLRSKRSSGPSRARSPQEHQDQVPPPVRQQPPQTLARPLDIQPHRPGRADNNHAERGLRGAVIHRKLSHGTQSERGERTLERLLSASITCRLRRRSLFNYLTAVITAHARGDPIPALS